MAEYGKNAMYGFAGFVIIALIALAFGVWWVYRHHSNKSIETDDIQDLAVTAQKIALNTITAAQIVADYNHNNGYRYINEEWKILPDSTPVPGSFADVAAVRTYLLTSPNFAWVTSYTTSTAVTYSVPNGGLLITNDTGSAGISFLTSTQQWTDSGREFTFETCIVTPAASTTAGTATTNYSLMVGLKTTAAHDVTTDDNKFYFLAESADASGATTGSYASGGGLSRLCFVYSSTGSDYISILPLPLLSTTIYNCKVVCDSARQLSLFVNGVQYNINNVAASTVGAAVLAGSGKSLALETNKTFKACVSNMNTSTVASVAQVNYIRLAEKVMI